MKILLSGQFGEHLIKCGPRTSAHIRLKSMGKEQNATFYDQRMEKVSLPLEESPWREVYLAVVGLLPPNCSVVDVGCGTGRCAEAIRRSGLSNSYLGFDFSPVRIAEAQAYVPTFNFQVADAFDVDFDQGKTYVITEVLEHIEDDLRLLSKIPSNSTVIFSVPNTDSEGHVRFFNNIEEVWRRYSPLLNFDDQCHISIARPRKASKPDRLIFILKAIRR